MNPAAPTVYRVPRMPWQRTGEPPAALLRIVMFAIAVIPLVKPRLPGNSGPADFFMVTATIAVFVWIAAEGRAIFAPFAGATAVLMTAGAISGLVADRAGPTLLVMLQEAHLLLFTAAIATVARTPRAIEEIRSAWVAAGVFWGALVVAAVASGFAPLINATTDRGTRAHLFFQNPNITGNYFLIAIFVAVASRPKSWPRRSAAVAVMLAAMLLTGSNAAILGLAAGAVVAVFVYAWRRIDPIVAVVVLSAILVAGAGSYVAMGESFRRAPESENLLIRYSIGRLERSAANRQDLFSEQMALYRERGILGIGPFATRDELGRSGESGVRSSHNDYLATLVERGPIGVAGLLLLAGAIGYRIARGHAGVVKPEWRKAAGTGAAMTGVAVALALSALTHEILHYRHLWALLGLIAAVHRWSHQDAKGGAP
ncbi:MAG TPA: O-antigen ligase family protein [Actinomycetota bacterium]|nr:O-antigen ligase family protein [Actinomycetota bacterium]